MVSLRFTVLPTLCWVLLRVAHSLALEDVSAGQQRLVSPPDKPVSVMKVQSQVSVVSTDIKSCLRSASPPSARVRFQKIKTKGTTFTRALLNQGTITTNASKMKTVNSTNIAVCARLADAEGFVGFSLNDGACNLFNITPQPSVCCKGRNVFYVRDSYWGPKGGPGIYSLKLTYGLSSISAEWNASTSANASTAAKFHLSWNDRIIVLNRTTFNYKIYSAGLCTDNLPICLKEVTLQAFDEAGTLMQTVTVTLTERTGAPLGGRRYLLPSSNCLYHDAAGGASFSALDTFCRTELHSTAFIAYVAGDYTTYRNDLIAMRSYTPSVDVYYHKVGLLQQGGIWKWQSGLTQPTDDATVWSGPVNNANTCGEYGYPDTDSMIQSYSCDSTDDCWVCHEYIR